MTKFTIKRKIIVEQDVSYKKYVGFKIEEIRKSKKLTQEEFANALGLSRTSIVNIEKGKQAVSLNLLYLICTQGGIKSKDILPF